MNVRLKESDPSQILGYEPALGVDVTIAFINHGSKSIRPCHGYFPPHRYGKETQKYAKELGYTYNAK